MPVLAAEIPSIENGGLAKDGMSVIWKLKQGVKWHDGQPFTADDCVFNWEYAADPATAATTIGSYKDIKVVKVDDHTIRVEFQKPTPFWADAFVGVYGMIIPKHLFETIHRRPNRARRRRTWRRSAPAPTCSWRSIPAIWCTARSTRTTTCPTGRISTPSR